MTRPTLRRCIGQLLIRVSGWVAVRGLQLVGESALLVRTPEAVESQRRMAEQLFANRQPCPCPRCTQARADAAARAN